MLPDKSSFISYIPVVNCCVRMGNNSFAPIFGTGSAVIPINGKCILIGDRLHVPTLRNPLYSLRAHQQQHGCGFFGMHNLGIYVFFPTFIVEVDMVTDCHLSYKPIGSSGKLPSLDYIQPKTITTSASNTSLVPSAPAVIKHDQDADDTIPVTYAGHWPKRPLSPPSPKYNLSHIPPTSYSVRLKDLTQDKLISWLYSVEFPESSSPPPDSSSHKTVTDHNTIDSSSNSAPLKLECKSSEDIMAHLHHPGSQPPPVCRATFPMLLNLKPPTPRKNYTALWVAAVSATTNTLYWCQKMASCLTLENFYFRLAHMLQFLRPLEAN
jgi:hypothetical protein